jgi:DNA-directed RNA polymerase II subunit RPB1
MAFSQKETRKALALRLGILSDLEISRLSVVDIYNEQLVDRYRNPMPHGVHDPRMGTMDRQIPCATCGCSYIECPGHFGSIALPQPVYHPGYINYIIKILRCICSDCGKLRADHLRTGNTGTTTAERERERIRKTHGGQQRFKKVYDICSQIKVCE